MALVIMERNFPEPLAEDAYSNMSEKAARCFDQTGVEWVASYLSLDKRRMICLLRAPDAEAVRQAYRTASLSFESVWTAQEFLPE